MKWFVESRYRWQNNYSLDFEACLDTPVYMYNLQSRHALKEHIDEFIKNNQGKILTREELELLCWEIDCLLPCLPFMCLYYLQFSSHN